MSKKTKKEDNKVVKQYRVCWLETNVVSATVDAKSPADAVKKAADHNEDFVTLVYGKPLPKSVWCVGTESEKYEDVPQSIADLADSLHVNLDLFLEDELNRLKNPKDLVLLRLTEKQNKLKHYEHEVDQLCKVFDSMQNKAKK